jgi:hypothetical protein
MVWRRVAQLLRSRHCYALPRGEKNAGRMALLVAQNVVRGSPAKMSLKIRKMLVIVGLGTPEARSELI